jgi:hypothetical protein
VVPTPPEAAYREREDAFAVELRRWQRVSRRYSLARLGTFLLVVVGGLLVLLRAGSGDGAGALWLAAMGIALAVFIALLVLHDRMLARERRARQLVDLNRRARARLLRRWADLPDPPPPPAPELAELPLARDLHLFGRGSLFHLLADALTPPGREVLARWLLEPAPPEEVRRRQAAVAELAPELDHRQELIRQSGDLTGRDLGIESFLAWAEGEPWLARLHWLRWSSFALPAVLGTAIVAAIAGPLPGTVPLLLALGNLVLLHGSGKEREEVFERVAARERRFGVLAGLLAQLARRRFESPLLADLQERLEASGLAAHQELERLHRRVELADSRRSAPLNFILQALLLWDLHLLAALERWQRRAGREVRGWLQVLGEVEALGALAGLRFDEPRWAFPQLDQGPGGALVARGLAHPLVPPATRVANDVTVGPAGTFLLVTGSNMSGKSTLLRALGVNVLLAQAGAPVCAEELVLPPLEVRTSVLIEDSLEDGVSFFMAELLRLQEIVTAAAHGQAQGRAVLYLLDEVLRGTNSRERRLCAQSILRRLLASGAIGAVSTHDPSLLEGADLGAAARPFHFRETIRPGEAGEPVMTFDYRLHPGISTGGNAVVLLRLVGLGDGPGPLEPSG